MCLRLGRKYAGDDTEQAIAAGGEDAFDRDELLAGHHSFGLVRPLRVSLSPSRQVRYLSSAIPSPSPRAPEHTRRTLNLQYPCPPERCGFWTTGDQALAVSIYCLTRLRSDGRMMLYIGALRSYPSAQGAIPELARPTLDVLEMISFEEKMTRLVSVNRSMKKKLRGWGGGSFHLEFGDMGSRAGWKDAEDVSCGRLVGDGLVQRFGQWLTKTPPCPASGEIKGHTFSPHLPWLPGDTSNTSLAVRACSGQSACVKYELSKILGAKPSNSGVDEGVDDGSAPEDSAHLRIVFGPSSALVYTAMVSLYTVELKGQPSGAECAE